MQACFRVLEVDGAGRAEFFAGPALALGQIDAVFGIDGILQRHRLGIRDVNRFAVDQAFVVFICYPFGTLLGAQAAGDALVHVHIARVLENGDREVSLFAGNCGDFGQGEQFDVDVPADLDQFGRDNSHGTVIGREGLVELRHNPTNGWFFLHQVNEISSIGKIQGGLHTGDARTDHQG